MSELSADFDPYGDDVGSFFGSIAHAVSSAGKAVGHTVSGAAKGVQSGISTVGSALGKVPVVGAGLKGAYNLTFSPVGSMLYLASGQRIDHAVLNNFRDTIAAAKDVAPYVQTVLSFVPGIGSGISAAMAGALTLAQGRPITEALIAATKSAIPGGPLAQSAFSVAQGALQGKPVDQIAINALPLSDQQKKLLTQGLSAAKDIAHGKNVAHSIVDHALQSLPPQYAKAVQIGMTLGHAKNLQDALKTGAQGAVALGASKVNPFFNAAKSLGSSQAGIQKAIGAAQAIKNGSPVLKKALTAAVSQFPAGSHGHLGFSTAISTLAKTAGNKTALGVARRALPSAAAQHAFDAAIGVVSHTVSSNPAALAQRAGSIFVPAMGKVKGKISPYQPNLKHAIDTLRRNPTLVAQHPLVLANKFGTSQQTILQAINHVQSKSLLPWRSLSPVAIRFIRKWQPNAPLQALGHGTGDTAGLDETGTKYIVAKGDFPFKIAQALTGNGNRWVELKPLNTDKKPDITQNVWVGEVLNLPISWQKPVVKPVASTAPAVISQPSPTAPAVITTPAPIISVAPGILQAKSILVAWSKTDGVNQAGVSDYGSTAADMSTDFGPRDKLELQSFQNWSTKSGNAPLVVDGILGPKSLAALQHWAETRAQAAVTPSVSSNVTTLPEVVIQASVPKVSTPVIAPTPAAPIPVASPAAPVVSAPAITSPAQAVPAVASPAAPTTQAAVAAQAPASGSKLAPALAGAAIGGVTFGLPGAIIGGIAGAAMA